MRALLSRSPGGPETLELCEIERPSPSFGQILIKLAATSLNYPDGLLMQDRYQVRAPRPFIPGGEMSGIVEAVGDGVTDHAPGDRVAGIGLGGGLAEYAVLDSGKCFTLPASVSFEAGAALIITYGTALHALQDHGRIKSGDRLLVLGAAGGVGLAAVELGKAHGAKVIAGVSSSGKAEAAAAAGADEVVVYPCSPADPDEARALNDRLKAAVGPEGAQLVFDPLGGAYAEPALRALGWGGRYLIVGFAAGIPQLKANLLLLKAAQACGVYWGEWADRDPVGFRAEIARLLHLLGQGRINPRISEVLPFRRAAEGLRALAERRAVGKVVVSVPE